jgi:group I intron endonuclease
MSTLYHDSIPYTSGIYRITCSATGKFYIGSTANLHKRYNQHFNSLRNSLHCNRRMQNAWNKYGPDAFVFEVIELVLSPFLLEREQYWLDKLKPFFNLAPVAGSLLGIERTPEHTKKISLALMGKPSPMRGIPRTPETTEKIKRTKQAKGMPHTPYKLICEGCGITFENMVHSHQRFCSRKCSAQRHKQQIKRVCIICSKEFQRQAAKISNYCSAKCSYQALQKDFKEAFWAKVDKTSECWIWTGGKGHGGYGLYKMGKHGRTIGAHRFAYEQTYGAIPDKTHIRHSCNNPSCVRPTHLFLRQHR